MKRRLGFFLTAILIALAGCNNRTWSSGDRVLVNKFVYETKLAKPERFDVVVFKYPDGPLEKNVPKNYIKRLLGLPGEILAIILGRLYHMPAPREGEPPYHNDVEKTPLTELWQRQYRHVDDKDNLKWFDEGKFKIVRKPPDVMMALRRIVYDNDFPATDLKGPSWQRWRPFAEGSSWKAVDGNGFSSSASKKDKLDWLRYQHILRPETREPITGVAPEPQLITDFMAYNSFVSTARLRPIGANWVGDLMLECDLKVDRPDGQFCMELSKGVNRFQASWDLSTGMCTLYRLKKDGGREEMDSKPTKMKSPGTYQLRFANIDARLTVWVDKELPFEHGREYSPPEVRGPGEKDEKLVPDEVITARLGPTENDLQPASLGVAGGAVEVKHIRLWRDTYYTQDASEAADFSGVDFGRPSTWELYKSAKARTMYVQPGHFLCMGDNSPQSSDSREWGTVPERLMLGRALLVYFPFNRAGPIH